MIHLILSILKIILILLGILFVCLLLVTLSVLFVPIRYSFDAKSVNEIKTKVKVTWLYSVISFLGFYEQEKFHYCFKIAGICMIDSRKPKKRKKTKRKKHKKKKNSSSKIIKEDEIKPAADKTAETDNTRAKTNQDNINESMDKEACFGEDKKEEQDFALSKQRNKILIFADKFSRIPEKIQDFFHELKRKWINLKNNTDVVKKNVFSIIDFIRFEDNKTGMGRIYFTLKKISHHILPMKLSLRIHFGTGDPYTTGVFLGAAGVIYSFYHEGITIIPDFEEAIIEGEVKGKGRVRIFTLLLHVLRLLLNKDFKKIVNNFKQLKEEL